MGRPAHQQHSQAGRLRVEAQVPQRTPERHPLPGGSATAPAPTTTPTSSATTTTPTATSAPATSAPATTAPAAFAAPPANAPFDYQIGDPYQPPAGVRVVSRDHGSTAAAGLYNICYVNGFQAQPDELSTWKRDHDDLLLKRNGSYVVDGDWNEVLLDTSTAAKRDGLVAVVGAWIDSCAAKGFRAVEVDNLDSWTRSNGLLTQAHAVAYATALATRAHAKGLAIAQKNAVEIADIGHNQIKFDFAVAEECANYEMSAGVPECQGYVAAYGTKVLVIEYDNTHFQQACQRYGETLSIIQRDVDVTAPGSKSYVYHSC